MINTNNIPYEISIEAQASIVANFDEEYAYAVILDNMNRRCSSSHPLPNHISILENQFRVLSTIPNANQAFINETRDRMYKKIIEIICKANCISIVPNTEFDDLYTIALYLYDLFICNFKRHLITFFTANIIKDRNIIYNALDMGTLKKKKDSSTLFGKKAYKNQKLAVIIANLDSVLCAMFEYDTTFEYIIRTIYPDKAISNMLNLIISPSNNIFNLLFVNEFKKSYSSSPQYVALNPVLVSEVKLQLHIFASNEI